MNMKRGLAMLLVLCLALSLAACGKQPATTTTTTTTVTNTNGDVVDTPDVTDGTTVEGETTTTLEGETTGTTLPGQTTAKPVQGGKVTTTKTTRGNRTYGSNVSTLNNKVDKPFSEVEFKEGTKKFDEGLNFGGETFTFANTSVLTGHLLEYKQGFEKAYNAKVTVEAIAQEEYFAKVAAKMATKEPYDILFTTALNYPENVLSNTFAPLEEHLTTADLWNDKSYKEGGFSKSLAQSMSWDGHMYVAGGPYLVGPIVVYYNKKMWKDAGYSGSQDPLALYKAGKWTWDVLYDQLSNIQDREKGKYGINDLINYNTYAFVDSFDTGVTKMTDDGRIVSNLKDTKLYNALGMLQKFSYGNTAVTNPSDVNDPGRTMFLSGKTAALLGGAGWYVDLHNGAKTSAVFSKSTSNLGIVPCPTPSAAKVTPAWQWMGYGAGNGTDQKGILAALAYAKYDSVVNHAEAYCKEMPDEIQKMMRDIIDKDNLRSSMFGFKSSAGSVTEVAVTVYTEVAKKGSDPAVVLNAYQRKLNTIIAAATGAA